MTDGISLDYLNPLRTSQDRFVVAGLPAPGICVLSGLDDADDIQVKKPTGSSGSTITIRGRETSKFTTTLRLWLPQHFRDVLPFLDLTKNDPKKPLAGLKVEHPELVRCNVFFAVRQKVGQLTHKGKQLYELPISWVQFAQIGPNATASAKGVISKDAKSPDGKNKGKEKSQFGDPELNDKIKELTEEAKKVNEKLRSKPNS